MVNEVIKLKWKGPIPFEKFSNKEICNSYPDLNENGVYLFCLKEKNSDSSFVVTYVGVASSYSIYDRISDWYKLTRNKSIGSYFRFDEKNDILDIILTHFELNSITDELINHNIESSSLFYSVPDKSSLENLKPLYRPYYEIEGTIKNILRKKMETRKYLLSLEPPKYGVDPKFIINYNEDPAIKLKGLI